MRILIAPDKFKGSLTAAEAAGAIQRGLARVWPDAEYKVIPVADGGEGTLAAFHAALGGALHSVAVRDALGRSVTGCFLLAALEDGRSIAVVETSEACGYLHIAPGERDPLRSNTCGAGTLLLAARDAGADEIITGIGGSATNDGGLGMAAALGFRFLDRGGSDVRPLPLYFEHIHKIVPPRDLRLPPITVASDVSNPLLGERGATAVYGPQKGLRPEDFELLETGMKHYALRVEDWAGRLLRDIPGAGAAGGLGFGLMAFCKASIRPGIKVIAEIANLKKHVKESDLVITGEGSLDAQTLEGKTAAGVAHLAREAGKPVAVLAGRVADEDRLGEVFDAWFSLACGPMPLDEAIKNAGSLLESAARRLAMALRAGRQLPARR